MIQLEKNFTYQFHPYIPSYINSIEELLFFDIETTGFSADISSVYLIGACYYHSGKWHLIQWFADDYRSEENLLHSFFQFMKPYKYLVHYNGTGFDIPYLTKKCGQYHLDYSFTTIENLDIYKKITFIKKLLNLPNHKQPTMEKFLGLTRQDPFTGGELIEVYSQYLQHKLRSLPCEDYFQSLLLHNEEDLTGLVHCMNLLLYCDLFCGSFHITQTTLLEKDLVFTLTCPLPNSQCPQPTSQFPQSTSQPPQPLSPSKNTLDQHQNSEYLRFTPNFDFIHKEQNGIRLKGTKDTLTLIVPIYDGELKYFYPNYKDYFYLPKEDAVVHKSIAQYVDKEYRIKSTRDNCYEKRTTRFLPQPEEWKTPAFRQTPKTPLSFFELTDTFLTTQEEQTHYITLLLNALLKDTLLK